MSNPSTILEFEAAEAKLAAITSEPDATPEQMDEHAGVARELRNAYALRDARREANRMSRALDRKRHELATLEAEFAAVLSTIETLKVEGAQS